MRGFGQKGETGVYLNDLFWAKRVDIWVGERKKGGF